MKQNTYNKGRNKNFTPKSKKFKSQPLKEDFDKKETIEETLDQRKPPIKYPYKKESL